MKYFIVVAMLFSGAVSVADVSLKTCQNFKWSEDQNSCAKIIKGATYSKGVANFCSSLRFGADSLNCLKVTKNVVLTEDALNFCFAKRFVEDKVSCLKQQALPLSEGIDSDTKLKLITSLADSAIFYMESGQLVKAIGAVLSILEVAKSE